MPTDIVLTGSAGEYMDSATVVAWTVAPGAPVRKGEVLVVVETAKAATEIEAPCDGVLAEILAGVGADVAVGRSLGRIAGAGEGTGEAEVPSPGPPAAPARVLASPLARRTAARHGLSLEGLAGTGPGGRIKARDVGAALRARDGTAGPAALAATPGARAAGARAAGAATAPVVFLHGFGASAAGWSMLLPLIHGHRCLALDLPGHGRQRRAAHDFAGLVRAVTLDIEEAGLEEVHFVGHSLGGAVAVSIAAAPTIPVRSLTLLAPAGLGPEIDGAFLDGFGRAEEARSLAPWLGRLVHDPAILAEGFADGILRERARFGLGPAQAALARSIFPNGTQTVDIRGALTRLACPVRVIWGMSDGIIPVRHAETLSGAPAVHRLRDVGHMPHVEAPALVARLLMETLRSGG